LTVNGWKDALARLNLHVTSTHGEPGARNAESFQQAVLIARKQPLEAARPTAVDTRFANIEGVIARVVAEVFEMKVEQVEAGKILSFSELGADSLLSAELATKIGAAFQLELKPTVIFNYPGVRELAQYIREEFSPAAAPDVRRAAAPPNLQDLLRKLEAGELTSEAASQLFQGDLIP
jgi:acyl carrier protein